MRGRLHYVQINGGEPLLHEETYQLFQRLLADEGGATLSVGVITNLNTPPTRLDRFRAMLPELMARHRFVFGVSQDAVAVPAECIRNGLRWEKFDANLRGLLRDFPGLEVQLAPTMSVLNVPRIGELLRYAPRLEQEFGPRIVFRPSMVLEPQFQSPLLLPESFRHHLDAAVAFLDEIGRWQTMRDHLAELANVLGCRHDLAAQRRLFHARFREYDRRRELRLEEVFPELADFWRECA